jgi:transcriptional regulator of acetoin/glycerol metabolism
VTLPALLRRAIKHARGLNHVEVTFESQHQFVDAVITLKPIVEEQGNSFILLLHPVEQMRQLMTSQLGKVSHTFEQMSADDPETRRLIHLAARRRAALSRCCCAVKRGWVKSCSARPFTMKASGRRAVYRRQLPAVCRQRAGPGFYGQRADGR